MENHCEQTEFRWGVYLLLARVFAREADALFLKQLQSVGLPSEIKRGGLDLGLPEADFSPELLETLSLEYTRLFIGPGPHISLYGSVHSNKAGDGRLWGDSTVEVKKFIEASGLQFSSDYGGIPDHLAVELEFLGHLVQAEKAAQEKEDQATVDTVRTVEKRFLQEYVLNWFPHFASAVVEYRPHPFYGGFTSFGGQWLSSELEYLEERMP